MSLYLGFKNKLLCNSDNFLLNLGQIMKFIFKSKMMALNVKTMELVLLLQLYVGHQGGSQE